MWRCRLQAGVYEVAPRAEKVVPCPPLAKGYSTIVLYILYEGTLRLIALKLKRLAPQYILYNICSSSACFENFDGGKRPHTQRFS